MSETYRNPGASVDARTDDLLARMTLDEKVAQLGCVWSTSLLADRALDEHAAEQHLTDGIGHVTRIGAATDLTPEESAAFTNDIQRWCVEHTRLGIPAVVHEEGVAGYLARGATVFPQAIGLAATFDPDLVGRMAGVIREQMLAVGARHTLSPVLDVARDPRWGRVEETYGEDPYLIGRLGVAYVRALQTDDLSNGVVCTGKHFLGYGLSDGGRNHGPVNLGPREMREVFAEPFAAVIRDAGIASIMNSYASVDGLPCGGSRAILTDLLRGELGFDGVVVADYFTVDLLMRYHRIARDQGEAAEVALRAGLDVELPATSAFAHIRPQVETGTLDEEVVDRAVRRMLNVKLRLGLFEAPYVDAPAAGTFFDTRVQRDLARTLAQRSIVVATNDGVLPIEADVRSLAVLGPAADDVRLLQGDYHYPTHLEIMGRAAPPQVFTRHVTPLDAIRARAGTVEVRHASTAAEVGDADVALVFVGARSGLTTDCSVGEARDASDLGLDPDQTALVDDVIAGGTPTVVVLVSGRVHALPEIAERAAALVYAWLPGEEAGNAIADVLFGDVDATGRMPVSVPRSAGHVPSHHNHRAGGQRSEFYGDYVDAPVAPLFAFGHGLSYTTFVHRDLQIGPAQPTTAEVFTVEVVVENIGHRAGTEVVQLYLRDVVASVARPDRQLVGFCRVELEPGADATVTFTVDPSQLAFHDEAMDLAVEPGEVLVMIGGLDQSFELGGSRRVVRRTEIVATDVRVT